MTAPQITHRSPATLTPWPRNARTHSKKQIRQIVASIRQFGFTVPVLIDEAETILAGHGRVAAATVLAERRTRVHDPARDRLDHHAW